MAEKHSSVESLPAAASADPPQSPTTSDHKSITNLKTTPGHHGTHDTEAAAPRAHKRPKLFDKRVHRVAKPLPWLCLPSADPNDPYVSPEHEPNEWLKLFFELAVAAVLAVFATSHDLNSADDLPDFLAYLFMIQWMFSTQLHYEGRFETDDRIHRFLKGVQLLIFLWIGITSDKWALSNIIEPGYVRAARSDTGLWVTHRQANQSFLIVCLLFLAHRVLMALQYTMVIVVCRRVGRPNPKMGIQVLILMMSAVGVAVGVAIPARSVGAATAKIVIVFGTMLLEFLVTPLSVFLGWTPPTSGEMITDRYATLSLMIIGEGFNRFATFFQSALSAWGQSNLTMYGQVVLAIGIVYCLWGFMFSHLRMNDDVDPLRTWLWEVLHYFLHFLLFMLTAAIGNAAAGVSGSEGNQKVVKLLRNWTKWLGGNLEQMLYTQTVAEASETIANDWRTRDLSRQLTRMDLQPPFEDFAKQFFNLTLEDVMRDSDNLAPTLVPEQYADDAMALFSQYTNKLIYRFSQTVGMKASQATQDLYDNVTSLEPTAGNLQAIDEMGYELQELVFIDLYAGVLWLYPVAGGVLLLCVLRSLIRYHFEGRAQWFIHGTQIIGGIGLCLAGIAVKGIHVDNEDQRKSLAKSSGQIQMKADQDEVEANTLPYFAEFTFRGKSVLVVFCVYAAVTILTSGMTWYTYRQRTRRTA